MQPGPPQGTADLRSGARAVSMGCGGCNARHTRRWLGGSQLVHNGSQLWSRQGSSAVTGVVGYRRERLGTYRGDLRQQLPTLSARLPRQQGERNIMCDHNVLGMGTVRDAT